MKTSCCQSKKVLKEKDYMVCMDVGCENYMRPTKPAKTGKWNRIFLFFFFIFIFLLSFNDFSYDTSKAISFELHKPVPKNSEILNGDNLRKQLDVNHIICTDQVYAQIMIESGHLNSFLTKKTNNLLGMRYPFRRKTTAVGIYLPATNRIIKGSQNDLKKFKSENHYAVYENWQDCIKDYKFWQDKSFKLTERYLTFLGNYYAEDSMYVSKIRKMSKRSVNF